MRKSVSLLAVLSIILSALAVGCMPEMQDMAFEPRPFPYVPEMGPGQNIETPVVNRVGQR
jgi:hypothetical protein